MIKLGNSASGISVYSCQPKTNDELEIIVYERIKLDGLDCDLNDIDTSLITDMSYVFYQLCFNGDISKWNVSNVKDMSSMFAYSKFNGDISRWDVSNVERMAGTFFSSEFNQDISNWCVDNTTNMYYAFAYSVFDRDISRWKINKDCSVENMFLDCPIKEEFKPKSLYPWLR